MANYTSTHTGLEIDAGIDAINALDDFGAASSSAAGTQGLVPAPALGDQGKFLRGDATWQTLSAMALVAGAVPNNIATYTSDGQIKDSGVAISGIATLNSSGKVTQTALKANAFTDGVNDYTLGASVTAANVAQITTNATNIGDLQTEVATLRKQNEWIGRTTCVAGEEQSTLTAFVVSTVSRQPRQGDQVTITNYGSGGQIWIYTVNAGGTYSWKFYTDLTPITDATTTTKGVVQIGDGLNVNSGVIKPQLASYTKLTADATVATETTNRNYAVTMDTSGDLAVTVPWVDTDTHNTHTVTVISGKNASEADITATSASSDTALSVTLGTSGITAGSYGDSAAQTPGYAGTFKVPYITANAQGIITGISEHTVTMPSAQTTTNTITNAQSTQLYLMGATSAMVTAGSTQTFDYNTNIYITTGNVIHGASWNDFAESRKCQDEPGTVVCEVGDGTLVRSTERLQAAPAVISDTFGMIIGPDGDDTAPIAVAGRVLAKVNENETYKAGDAVCADKDGRVSVMTRKEIKEYPDRILGYVSEIPTYEFWNETEVKGRIWIKIK